MNGPLAPFLLKLSAQFFAFIKRYDAAIARYRQLVAIDPKRQDIWRAMGFLYAEQKDPTNAINAFREAIKLDPADFTTRFNLGFIHHERGEHDAAIEQFTEVVRLSPIVDRAWYGLGLIYLGRDDLPKAIEHLKEAARLQYFNPHAAHHLIHAYKRAGQQTEAIAELNRLNGFDPNAAAAVAREVGFKLVPVKK
jgi:tetratricopeptide (TPR) repeat protein